MALQRFSIGEESWEFDENDLTLNDMFMIKAQTGLTTKTFGLGLTEMDPDALRALVWYLKMKAGTPVNIDSIDFKLSDFKVAPVVPLDFAEVDETTTASEQNETPTSAS